MKRKLSIISLVLLVMIALCGCSSTNRKSPGHLGDYEAVFLGIKTGDEENPNGLVVGYEFTNHSDKEISFEKAMNPDASQDGQVLQRIYLSDDSVEPTDVLVAPGETQVINVTYVLANTDSIIELKLYNKETQETYTHNVAPKLF